MKKLGTTALTHFVVGGWPRISYFLVDLAVKTGIPPTPLLGKTASNDEDLLTRHGTPGYTAEIVPSCFLHSP